MYKVIVQSFRSMKGYGTIKSSEVINKVNDIEALYINDNKSYYLASISVTYNRTTVEICSRLDKTLFKVIIIERIDK